MDILLCTENQRATSYEDKTSSLDLCLALFVRSVMTLFYGYRTSTDSGAERHYGPTRNMTLKVRNTIEGLLMMLLM